MFIHTKVFDRQWALLGCDDDDLQDAQKAICADPQAHPIIRGTGGIRKMRIALSNRGKRGGARVLYIDFIEHETIGLLYAYAKNEKEDINAEERKLLKAMVEQLDEIWRKRS